MEREVARVQAEAEARVQGEVERLRSEAERARLEAELARSERSEAALEAEKVREAAREVEREIERVRAESAAQLQKELERVRAEAERARADAYVEREADAARAQAQVESLRQTAIDEARSAAEEAAQRAMEREVARVKAEAEARMQEEVNRLRTEAEKARNERSEAEQEAEKVREAAREVEREIERVRAESAEQLQQELERLRLDADRMREAERSAAREEAERLREAAAQDARAVAEAALKSELDRVRAESDARIAAEVSQLRAEGDQKRASELAELRAQLTQVRDTAAQQAQRAAADAIAAEVARANRERAAAASPYAPRPEPPRPAPQYAAPQPEGRSFSIPQHHRVPTANAPHGGQRHQSNSSTASRPPRDVWSAPIAPMPPPAKRPKWQLAAVAAVLLIAAGTASYNWLPLSVQWTRDEAPAAEPDAEPPKPTAPVRRAGAELRLDSTPTGATVSVDGRRRGVAPLVLKDLTVGTHSVVFEADGISINRSVRVRADQPQTLTQDMTAGFLSIFSRVPVDVRIDGRPAGNTEDGQILVAPGSHTVLLENPRFNFKSEFKVQIRPSEVTAHTVMLPMGALLVTTDVGAEVWIEGERVGVAPLGPIAVAIGTREIVVKQGSGESRQSVEVVYGRQSEVTLHPGTGAPGSNLPAQMPPLSAPPAGPAPQ